MVQREDSKKSRGPEPTGEPETLAGKISQKQMGTYAGREKAPKPH